MITFNNFVTDNDRSPSPSIRQPNWNDLHNLSSSSSSLSLSLSDNTCLLTYNNDFVFDNQIIFTCVSISNNNEYLLMGCDNGRVILYTRSSNYEYNYIENALTTTTNDKQLKINSCCISTDNNLIIYTCLTSIFICELKSTNHIMTLNHHDSNIMFIDFIENVHNVNNQINLIVLSQSKLSIHQWSFINKQQSQQQLNHLTSTSTTDGAAFMNDHMIMDFIDINSIKEHVLSLNSNDSKYINGVLTLDCLYFITLDSNNQIQVWNLVNQQIIDQINGYNW